MLSVGLLFALVGAVAGLVAGLFGLGGGVIMVPALIYSFALLNYDASVLTHMAVGTSLACIVVNAAMSTRIHIQKRAVDVELLKRWVPGILLGAWMGGVFAAQLNGSVLQMAFATFLVFVGVSMLMSFVQDKTNLPGLLGCGVVSTIFGTIASLFGIGGGSLTVPYLRYCSVPMQKAVATSAAQSLPLALAGSLSFLWQGWGHPSLPAGSTGFIYWPAFVGLTICSVPTARLGAKLAHQLPADKLQRAFALVLLLVAGQLFFSAT